MFKPLHDIILIERDEAITTNASGIYLASPNKLKPSTGTVLATGPGRFCEHTGVFIQTTVKVGQKVYFTDKSGYPIELGPEYAKRDIIVMREVEIIGVIPFSE